MTTWADIRAQLPIWIATLSKEPLAAIGWLDIGRPSADPAILLSVSSMQDVIYHESVATTSRTIDNHKTLTVQVRVESISEDSLASALLTADRIRLRSQRSDYQRLLVEACGVRVIKMPGDSVNISYNHFDTKIHARSFDLFLAAHFQDADTDESLGVFEQIGVGGTEESASIVSADHYVPEVEP